MSSNQPVQLLLNDLGISQIKPSDEFSINYKNGMLETSVKRESGKTESILHTVPDKGFLQMTSFDPNEITQSERNNLIKKLHNNGKGESQSSIARKFGLKQPHISRIINDK